MFIHFSQVSKMTSPCWSLPTSMCIGGQKRIREGALYNIPYVCRVCYANCGPTRFSECQEALTKNWESYASNPVKWVEAVSKKIWAEYNALYFRWFHSGDLQSREMLEDLIKVAEKCPETKFWLPTQERELVWEVLQRRSQVLPKNLVIRISSPVIDKEPKKTQGEEKTPGVCYSMVCYNKPTTCPAHKQGGLCGTCRICWNKNVALVAYPLKVGKNYWPLNTAKRFGLI